MCQRKKRTAYNFFGQVPKKIMLIKLNLCARLLGALPVLFDCIEEVVAGAVDDAADGLKSVVTVVNGTAKE